MGNLVNRLERDNQTETFNVIITPQMETAYKITLQTIGICSTLLSIVIIFLIIFRTPSKIFAMGVLFETLAMFFICLLQRFVVLTDYIGNNITLNTIKTASIVLSGISPIYLFFFEHPKWKMIQYIEIFFSAGSVTLIISISKYISQMSSTSSRSHFIIFSLFLSLPTLIIVTPLLFALDSGTTFFQISESILCSHGLANSIVTIAFNSNFKRAITEHFLWNSLAGIQNSRAGKRQSIIGINQHRPSISLY
ncbi:hypothetical protein PRIPAC_79960 [Pristionchus pacificus]|nr:hypothetical protein PRIPAC_79960 [Pristionchus pacificus]|eukprot:PDM72164.1 hypothetical protein PRIPAC_38598 [Pristionchus pacificus]